MSFRKVSFAMMFVLTLMFGAITASAQTGSVSGKVFKKVDGERQMLKGIKIDCFRTDIAGGCRTDETNDKGEFVIVGIPLGAKIILGVSGPGIEPTYVPEIGIGSGSENLAIEVFDGNGRAITETEVRAAALPQGELTADQKKAKEEFEKKRAEIAESNKQIEERNAQREVLMKEGVAAFKAKDYDTAIEKFRAGYELDPEFEGSAPGFLSNKAIALKLRAVESYNKGAKEGSVSQARSAAAKDFREGIGAALNGNKMASASTTPLNKENAKRTKETILDSFNLLSQMGLTLSEGLESEEQTETVIKMYRDSLEMFPKNEDIMGGLSLALFSNSYFAEDQTKGNKLKQESTNYCEAFLKTAKKDHKLYKAIGDILGVLKAEGFSAK